ncbi:MAG: CTB family bacteriocin [Mastigocoleus sp. MO_167.B18]|uniref:CTB family bacteriocin n=1 Tax=Mastigocoleus sp. MO_188.B34 TaxID=3036635 RepID=UPI0026359BC5|nr:CTB family bacteriocin [Mastigocoleus sp. MO_188.B34]MDJ0695512.1 CTB family bacteriocin [Mastigocoleus sp. MO_188.B34]MDJ0775898.1 CTB family bacteriocin [Mastigocoleus sp. MO_167.B18]
MSFTNNEEAKLFAQLSEEQEEIISGGNGDDIKLDDIGNFGVSKTDFLYKSIDLATVSASGKDGSVATGALSKKVLDTSGLNVIVFDH